MIYGGSGIRKSRLLKEFEERIQEEEKIRRNEIVISVTIAGIMSLPTVNSMVIVTLLWN